MEMPLTFLTTFRGNRLPQLIVCRMRQTVADLKSAEYQPVHVGIAFGLGTLMSLNPVPVLDMVLALLLLRLMPRLPRAPYLAAMATWNSLVMAPLYASMPGVGRLVINSTLATAPSGDSVGLLVCTIAGGVVIAGILVTASIGAVTLLTHLVRRQCELNHPD